MTPSSHSAIQVGGHAIAFRRAGDGPALVLLHGFLCDSRVWERQLTGLGDGFTVIAWDAPGAGLSSDPPDTYTLADWARCLSAFLDGLRVERASVVGLSWGGILAQELWHLDRGRFDRLILAGTYAGWKGSLPAPLCAARLERCLRDADLPADERATRWVPELLTDAARPAVRDTLFSIVADAHPPAFRLMARTSAEADTSSLLPYIDTPTLLVWGDDDRRSPLSVADQFRASLPDAELVVIADAGHLCNMQQPESFNASVRRFCSG